MKLIKSKKAIVLLVVAIAAIASVGAYAFFTSTGTGSGTGKTGSASNYLVTGASESSDLFPYTQASLTATPALYTALTGGSVKNVGTGQQNLAQIVATIQAPTLGSNTPNVCVAADYRLFSPGGTWVISGANNGVATLSAINDNLAPGATHAFGDLSVAMVDNGANQDGCQGATVNIKYDAS
jgi:hypothetical protein